MPVPVPELGLVLAQEQDSATEREPALDSARGSELELELELDLATEREQALALARAQGPVRD